MFSSAPDSPPARALFSRGRAWALAACLGLLVIGFRWAFIGKFGTDLPEWDQWDGEGRGLLNHWSHGELRLEHFLAAHNEHRIALTRLVTFVAAKLNGQWDQRLEAVCNAFLPAVLAGAFLLLAARQLPRRRLALFAALLALFYATPVSWQNIVHGFHSQQFFLTDLALGTLVLLPFAEPLAAAWWAGSACAVLSLGSMGTGLFAPLIAGGVMVVLAMRRERSIRAILPGLLVCVTAVAVGVLTRAVVPANAELRAHTFHDFFMCTVRSLGWPDFDLNWGYSALLLYVPWVWLMGLLIRRRERLSDRWQVLLGALGLWAVMQVLAASYARGNGGLPPPSRYLDNLIIGLIVNALCLDVLTRHPDVPGRQRDLAKVLAFVWTALFAIGIWCHETGTVREDLSDLADYHTYCEANVRHYVATGDPAYLHHDEIPYPSEAWLAIDLDDPGMRHLLPASVAQPLAITPAENSTDFARMDTRVPESLNQKPHALAGLLPGTPPLSDAVTWGSFGAQGAANQGVWRSRPMVSPVGGWLRFEVAGDPGAPGVGLELHDAASGRLVATVQPDKAPGNSWRAAWVRAPHGRFVIVARDESPREWLAFSEPVEMGRGSHWAWDATRRGSLLAILAGVAGVGVLIWRPRRP